MLGSTVTVDEDAEIAAGDRADRGGSAAGAPKLPLRYTDGRRIATGGMGDVWSFRDDVLGRRVAVKVLTRRRRAAAFEREARIQARLCHPAIVPIHDIGDDDGQPYLVMTEVEGQTLEQILGDHRRGRLSGEGGLGHRQLLTAFVRVCQAVAYAHAHGVVHRDLKPSNIMLGALGEVYVLDWGISIFDDPTRPLAPITVGLAGTLGYMPPEQVAGGLVDQRADIYALGATLFEIVTSLPLHHGDDAELLASTLRGVDVQGRALAERAALPPELAAICRRATAIAVDDRYPRVADLVADLERFLDGERDDAGRRALADELVTRARHELQSGRPTAAALRDAGRALALAPDHREAAAMLRDALERGHDVLPPDVAEQLADGDRFDRRRGAIIAAVGIAAWLSLFGGGIALGIREPTSFVVFSAAAAVGVIAVLRRALARGTTRHAAVVAAIAGAVAVAMLSRLAGPFLLGPLIAASLMPAFSYDHTTHRRWLLPLYVAAVVLPLVAEALGWVEPSAAIGIDTIVIRAQLAGFSSTWSPILLCLTSVAAIAVAYFAASRAREAAAQQRIDRVRVAWQLEQVLPQRVDDDDLGRGADGNP